MAHLSSPTAATDRGGERNAGFPPASARLLEVRFDSCSSC